MSRILAHPEELDLDSPGRRDYWVMLEHDSVWGHHLVPLTVFVGRAVQEGRGLVAFGGNHGNEYEGPIAVKRLLGEIDVADVTGRVILVPVLNVEAFRAGTRESIAADGVNLNRAFVEGAGETPALSGITHRIARFVRESLWPRVHVVIDIHSGGNVARFAPCASFHKVSDARQAKLMRQTAAWFGTPFILTYANTTPGLLPSEAERLGKVTIGTELGFGESVNHQGVIYAMHGIRAAAIHHDQMRGRIEPIGHHRDGTQRCVTIADRPCAVYAPFSGHYEEVLPCGAPVRRDDVVGRLHDFDHIDEPPWDVRAGCDGYVIAQAWHARVTRGQNILCVGQVTE
jgi:N2-acetyl-L-2,4-diaminobutanoate deacetylase